MESSEFKKNLEKSRAFQQDLLATDGDEQIRLSRAATYGGAAAGLAMLLAVTQIQERSFDVQLTIFCAAVSIPLWLSLATMLETYLYFGASAHGHYRTKSAQLLLGSIFLAAGLLLATGVGGLVHHLLPWATWPYLIGIFIALCTLTAFQAGLQDWQAEDSNRKPTGRE